MALKYHIGIWLFQLGHRILCGRGLGWNVDTCDNGFQLYCFRGECKGYWRTR